MVTPCKDCTKRNASCHSSCKDYLGWKDEINKYNEQRRKEKTVERIIRDCKHNLDKITRKGHR